MQIFNKIYGHIVNKMGYFINKEEKDGYKV